MHALYPLRFHEILRDYHFGGRRIPELFAKEGLPAEGKIAETWEVCDRPGETSITSNGPLAGTSLHELIRIYGSDLLGTGIVATHGTRFPLLIKLLDATFPLAEQVHQDDDLARAQGLEDTGKTEAWHILEARPGATVHCGTREGITKDGLESALVEGTVVDAMEELPARAGDTFLLHAGTIHYSRGGILLYEVMQNSDVITMLCTSRHPPGSPGRAGWAHQAMEPVHVIRGSACKTVPVTVTRGRNSSTHLVACRSFTLARLDLAEPSTLEMNGDRFHVLTQVSGTSEVTTRGGTETLAPGLTCLLPAAIGQVTITPRGPCALLDTYVPDLQRDVVNALLAQGVPAADVAGLGGRDPRNLLPGLLAAR